MKVLQNLNRQKERFFSKMEGTCIRFLTAKNSGIDGLLVTVGLCIIALVLCVVMKESLSKFITDIVKSLQDKAVGILDISKV